MKKLSLILLLISCSIKLFAQTPDCKKFKTGTFRMTFSGNTVIIKRSPTTQKEYLNGNTVPATFNVKWIDNCTYSIIPDEDMIKNNPNISKGLVITSKIIKTVGDTYTVRVSTSLKNSLPPADVTKISDNY